MQSRASVVARSLLLCAAAVAAPVSALELPLPPPGEDMVGEVQVISARYEDTFADLGTAHGFGYYEMIAANPGVDPWLPGEGTEVILPSRFILPSGPREGIVINLPEYRLYYFPKGENVVHTFPLGIGREDWASPVGATRITAKTPNPAWYPPKSIRAEHAAAGDPLPSVVPPGPNNPLGPYKLTLGIPGYLIHGSNKKFGIGMRVSHGCFRMFNHDVLKLAAMASVGTPVRIVDEPYKFGVSQGRVFLEAHSPLMAQEEPTADEKHAAVINALLKQEELVSQLQLSWDVVRDVVAAEDGLPIEISTVPAAVAVEGQAF